MTTPRILACGMSTRLPIVLYDPLPHAERMAPQIGDATYGGGLRRPHAGTPIAPQWRERRRLGKLGLIAAALIVWLLGGLSVLLLVAAAVL